MTEHRLGWIIHYQSQAYLHSGHIRDMLVPNPPYLVDGHDGSIHGIPAPDYAAGLWEQDYEQRIKPAHTIEHDPWDDVPFAAELRQALDQDGRIAAIRLLRHRAPTLTMTQAADFVTAVAAGERPSPTLLDQARSPEPHCPRWGYGPSPASPQPP
ncbi:hypothetical protein FHU30_002722 [Actinomadura rupiterrae]|nr:hypothetical protein [Actinomadura rupiterrae]